MHIKKKRGYQTHRLSRPLGSRIAFLPRISNAEPTLCQYTRNVYHTPIGVGFALPCSRNVNLRDSKGPQIKRFAQRLFYYVLSPTRLPINRPNG